MGECLLTRRGGITGITTSSCENIKAYGGNGYVDLYWEDPPAREVREGIEIIWKETVIRYKEGSAPISIDDGILCGTSTTRNEYLSTPFRIEGLTNEKIYYFSIFPKNTSNITNASVMQIVSSKPKDYSIYTVKIDQTNSNPLNCCTYADDAEGMVKGSSLWDDIFGYKPCIMKDGEVVGYLNPDDFTKYEDGSDAPITDTSYDVMIEFPRMGLNITTSGDIISVSLTNAPNDSNFEYRAHKRGDLQKDYFYLGAYSATGSSSKLGSNSGSLPLVSTSLTGFINYAHNRGSGYEVMAFYQWTYVQALYVLKYGNLNSQQALGYGYVGGSVAQTTGATNTKGMNYGNTSSQTDRVKLFGLEDLWGNVFQWLSGLYCTSNYELLTTTDNFGTSTSSSSWEYTTSSGVTSDIGGYITKVQGTNGGGFVVKVVNGSATTFFSDYGYLYGGYFPYVGGGWSYGANAGVFRCDVNYSAGGASSYLGARLMYL